SPGFLVAFALSIVVVGIGFIFHELAHKVLAQRYGCQAEFRSFDMMLIIAILIAFSGFIFIAPGAVMIGGRHISKKENGKISAVGPLTNIILALVFFGLSLIAVGEVLPMIMQYGFILNSLLAVFNMLPFGNFDGIKVFRWNKLIWLGMLIVSGLMFVFSYTL
ncbi:site-2 protease family protein, partial [Candidatus Woesearchaeota archaeon]|nr:site-2 protease family protein [Candidatus Woesearchaeota archaeon]